ncbi:MAG: hypothetical protein LC123_02415 [Burkholderiales bacterium]|nr:hypothetical protein [Burkholderiales bacterium]
MARPEHTEVVQGQNSWDSTINDNFGLIFNTPLPPKQYADYASLPAASSYDRCVAMVVDENVLVMSNGTTWLRMGTQAALVADASGWADATAQTKFNDLLTALKNSKLMASS